MVHSITIVIIRPDTFFVSSSNSNIRVWLWNERANELQSFFMLYNVYTCKCMHHTTLNLTRSKPLNTNMNMNMGRLWGKERVCEGGRRWIAFENVVEWLMFAMPIAVHHLTTVMSCSTKKRCGRMRNGFIITSSALALAVTVARDAHDEFFLHAFNLNPHTCTHFQSSTLLVVGRLFFPFIFVIWLLLWVSLLSPFLLHCILMTCCAIRKKPTSGTMLRKQWEAREEAENWKAIELCHGCCGIFISCLLLFSLNHFNCVRAFFYIHITLLCYSSLKTITMPLFVSVDCQTILLFIVFGDSVACAGFVQTRVGLIHAFVSSHCIGTIFLFVFWFLLFFPFSSSIRFHPVRLLSSPMELMLWIAFHSVKNVVPWIFQRMLSGLSKKATAISLK